MSGTETARLSLPARPEFVSVARLTLAGLATRLGFDYDQVEDIRIAVAEAMTLLLREDEPGATIDLDASWSDDTFEIAVRRGAGVAVALDRDEAAIAIMVMEALMDNAAVEQAAEGQAVRLRKARATA